MAQRRFNEDKQRLVELLSGLPQEEATRVICLLTLGGVQALRSDYSVARS